MVFLSPLLRFLIPLRDDFSKPIPVRTPRDKITGTRQAGGGERLLSKERSKFIRLTIQTHVVLETRFVLLFSRQELSPGL